MSDDAIATLAPRTGTRAACAAVGAPQASYYRWHRAGPPPVRPAPVRAQAPAERQAILDLLHSDRFADAAPAEVWAALPADGVYLGSISTFSRMRRSGSRLPLWPGKIRGH